MYDAKYETKKRNKNKQTNYIYNYINVYYNYQTINYLIIFLINVNVYRVISLTSITYGQQLQFGQVIS